MKYNRFMLLYDFNYKEGLDSWSLMGCVMARCGEWHFVVNESARHDTEETILLLRQRRTEKRDTSQREREREKVPQVGPENPGSEGSSREAERERGGGGGGYQRVRPPASSSPGSQGPSRGRGPAWAAAASAPGPWGSASGSCARWSNEWTSGESETTLDWCPGDFLTKEGAQEERNAGGGAKNRGERGRQGGGGVTRRGGGGEVREEGERQRETVEEMVGGERVKV